ncbi:hypothetical protein [Meridianimaribacter sp. CL38]|uniref:hypothetical protein n=1 Tax=Meridianimaribacter sp. CL38 TaxID=2213021 RepID=UPI00103AFB45|nr:hypothetical protein [Meridianimaribacter sp. CL38]
MKKFVFILASMLLGLTSATATAQGEGLNNTRYRYAQPIMFVERGVEFMIFPDGSFDFNTNIENTYQTGNVYYRSTTTHRSSVNVTYGAPGTVSRVHYSTPRSNQGVFIQHDSDGKIRRIGNVYLNYDRQGRIKRAGTVYMSYQRGNGRLKQVGGLRVNYNAWGEIVHASGVVNHSNSGYVYSNNTSGDFGYGYYSDFDDADDYYYYRQGSEVKKQKKIKIKV